jgi:hypothetical protein
MYLEKKVDIKLLSTGIPLQPHSKILNKKGKRVTPQVFGEMFFITDVN